MSRPVNSNHPKIHQRKISLTTACPPTSSIQDRRSLSHSSSSSPLQWCQRLWSSRFVRWAAYLYILFSMLFCASQLLSSTSLTDRSSYTDNTLYEKPAGSQEINTAQPQPQQPVSLPLSKLNVLNTQLRLSKMFSKSVRQPDNVRPFWLTASEPSTPLSIATVLTLDNMDLLERMATNWKGSISAVIQIETKDGMNSGHAVQALSRLRREYETRPSLGKYVDIHLILLPPQATRVRLQAARNMARLFSRSPYIMHTPIKLLWLPSFDSILSEPSLTDRLDQGDALVVPTFAFPRRGNVQIDVYPTDRDGMIDWVDSERMGLSDHHWPLNAGPTSYREWRLATEPYLVTEFDYHYGPVYITTKENHPWCEERFDDQLPACVYTTFLNGADFYVLPDVFIIRSGQEPENELTEAERAIQDSMYKNYRIEQCAFYARKFDQQGVYETERAIHVKQECVKALRKENIV